MKHIPSTQNALVLRTDFSDSAAWEAICSAIQQPIGAFKAHVECVSDPEFAGMTPDQLIDRMPQELNHSFFFIVDQATLSHPDHPILVIDVYHEPGRAFRVIPSEMWGVENNLSLSNMDFEEFAEAVDNDGVFRGFAQL